MAVKDVTSNSPGVLGKKKAVVAPTKQTMNFVHHESSFNLKKLAPVLLLIIIAAALFTKFGIMDQLNKKVSAYRDLSNKQNELSVLNAKLTGYDELAADYGRYSYGRMSEQEIGMVDRMDVLDLIQKKIMSVASVESFSVNSNTLNLNLSGITLNQASSIVKDLESSELVESASVNSASAQDGSEAIVVMSIILTKEVPEE